MPDAPSGVQPTRIRALVLAAVVGGGVTFLMLLGVSAYAVTMPNVPWTTPMLMFAGAVAAAVLARVTYLRNHVVRQQQDPRRALSTLAIAKALLIGGSLLAGGYLVFALFSVGHLDAPLPKQRLVIGLVTAASAICLVVSGWALERACRTPDDRNDENPDT
jgi:membrane protein implicated in regulation of membrane protease activity